MVLTAICIKLPKPWKDSMYVELTTYDTFAEKQNKIYHTVFRNLSKTLQTKSWKHHIPYSEAHAKAKANFLGGLNHYKTSKK